MKRHGNLFDKIIDVENIKKAFYKAAYEKHWQNRVRRIEANLDFYCQEIHDMLENGTYKTSDYKIKKIYEPKERDIYILPFYPDRIVQHAILNIIEPIWDNMLYYHSYSCRDNKGPHHGSDVTLEMVMRNKYCLKCDISKFYPSVNHEVMKHIVRKKIKDVRLLNLLDEIIDSIKGETNIPIGNFLSQWFGNLYLNELDYMAKHIWKVKDYIRYCDDYCFFSNSKSELNEIKLLMTDFVNNELKMRLSKCELFPTSHGVDFLGYRHFPKGYVLVRKSTAKRVKKYVKEIIYLLNHNLISYDSALCRLGSIYGWIKHANSQHFILKLNILELIKYVKMKRDSVYESS